MRGLWRKAMSDLSLREPGLQIAVDSPLTLTPMIQQYYELKANYKDCLLLFRLGDFYELFFDDAVRAARLLNITLTRRGKKEGEDIPMCGIPFHAADSYISRLVKQGCKVALAEQMESPEEAKRRGHKSIVKRDVIRVITAGTLTEESLLDPKNPSYLVALVGDIKGVAVAAADISTGICLRELVSEHELEGVLSRLSPQEILMTEKLSQIPSLVESLIPYKAKITHQVDSRFDYENNQEKIKKFYGVASLDALGSWSDLEVKAVGALLDYISLTQKSKDVALGVPMGLRSGDYLQMDASTQRNLEIFTTLRGEKRGSLLEAVDYTCTAAGGRALRHALAYPFARLEPIQNRLDQVAALLEERSLRESLEEILKKCPDGERAFGRLAYNRGGPRDLKMLERALGVGRQVHDLLKGTPLEAQACFSELSALVGMGGLEEKLARALVEAPPILAREGGFVKSGYLQQLDELRHLKDHGHQEIATLQARYVRETGIPSLKIKFNNILGYYIEITAAHRQRVPEQFIHRQTLVNGARFSSVELTEIQEKLHSASSQCLEIEATLFQGFVRDVLGCAQGLAALFKLIAELDLVRGLAELAHQRAYGRPHFVEAPSYRVLKGRHPVVEAALSNARAPFAPNDCSLSCDGHVHLVTGPNMAGKSTYLRQNALIVLLAHVGSFVPAESAELGLVDRLYSRIGASDDLARGHSTFMVEMIETAAIINQSTSRSFVILDEMGRGTSTYDGMALAASTLEYLHDRLKCRALFATHYHELVDLKESLPCLRCYTMDVKEWEGKIIFTHTLKEGAADKSYGIQVAQLAGLPEGLLKRAREFLELWEKKGQTPANRAGPSASLSPVPTPINPILRALLSVEINDISPKQAFDILYGLHQQTQALVLESELS